MTFTGNVVVEKDDSSLLAQKMKVIYTENANPKAGQKKNEIERIDAEENVKIFSEEFIGSGDLGHFEPKNNLFILEKNVIVNNGTSIASGDKFNYNTVTKKGHFVGRKDETSIQGNGGDKRVVVVIGNDIKKDKKSNKKENDNKDSKR